MHAHMYVYYAHIDNTILLVICNSLAMRLAQQISLTVMLHSRLMFTFGLLPSNYIANCNGDH